MSLFKFNDKLEQGLCLSAVGISLLFVILGLVADENERKVTRRRAGEPRELMDPPVDGTELPEGGQ